MTLAPTPDAKPEELLRLSTSFDLAVTASFAETTQLFTPEGERAWAGEDWDPQFVYPQPGRDEPGAVFTIGQADRKATWVITQLNLEAKHFQYVYFLPDLMIAMIDVHFKTPSPGQTRVHVIYTRTALTPEGNGLVTAKAAEDRMAEREWQAALDKHLDGLPKA
jgi:hypothetical protein